MDLVLKFSILFLVEPALKRIKVDVSMSDKEVKQHNLIKKIIDERQKFKSRKKSNFLSSTAYNSSK